MPLFFFHLREPGGLSLDDLGVEFPDVETAYLEADRAVRDIARELQGRGRNPRHYAFEIANGAGECIFELPFSETLDRGTDRRASPLARTTMLAVERAEHMTRLAAEVAHQTQLMQDNIRTARDLVACLRGLCSDAEGRLGSK